MDALAARTLSLPRILWIELTSRCPFDCVFCSRAILRGAGQKGLPTLEIGRGGRDGESGALADFLQRALERYRG